MKLKTFAVPVNLKWSFGLVACWVLILLQVPSLILILAIKYGRVNCH